MTAEWFRINDSQVAVAAPVRFGLMAQYRDGADAIQERAISPYQQNATTLNLPTTYFEMQRQPIWLPGTVEGFYLNARCALGSAGSNSGYDTRLALTDGGTTEYSSVDLWLPAGSPDSTFRSYKALINAAFSLSGILQFYLEAKEHGGSNLPTFSMTFIELWVSQT